MNDLQIFIYGGEQLRTIQQPDGLWWVLRDVCQVLGLAEPHRVASRLDDDEKGRTLMTTPGGTQEVTIINEPGLYSVILRSDKPEAKAFKRWVTHEVLPSIRRTASAAPAPMAYRPSGWPTCTNCRPSWRNGAGWNAILPATPPRAANSTSATVPTATSAGRMCRPMRRPSPKKSRPCRADGR